jgi:catechol 2,3-dioxygenase-like lactoylglutathione lyase family enzyme
MDDTTVSVRYMADDVQAAIDSCTTHPGLAARPSAIPAFADVTRGSLRLLLAEPSSSAGRPMPGGWNRTHVIVPDIAGEVTRLQAAGITFRNDIVTGPGLGPGPGPGGQQILLEDPAGNTVELFTPAG